MCLHHIAFGLSSLHMNQLFQRTCDQYDKLRKRNAFLEPYRGGSLFQDSALQEFDESREVVQDLIREYQACETPDYINYGQ